ncbi:putative quinol monooxygenase [Rhodococcus koreensis]
MAITALLDLKLIPDSTTRAQEVLAAALAQTRAFPGCISVDVLIDTADKLHWTLLEVWESEEHDARYRDFRAGEGRLVDLGELLAAPPVLTKYTTDSSV